MDIRIDTAFQHKNPNVYIPLSCVRNPDNQYSPKYMPLTIFNEDTGPTKLVQMIIDTGDSPPVSSRPYTLPLKQYKWVQREIESLE